jgi:uncharacterized protein GlcG (DUF336 family)/mannose-6-phosphate isomerase-like protein (cupin superfamily)
MFIPSPGEWQRLAAINDRATRRFNDARTIERRTIRRMKLPAFALCLVPLSCFAQQLLQSQQLLFDASAPQMVIKGSDIAARIAKSAVPDPSGSLRGIELLLQQGVYRVNLEYHPGPSGVGLNEDVAELMVVLEGSGTILLGGTPVDPVRSGFHLQASTAQGSTSYAVEKGDAILIPQGVAHAIGPVKSRLILMSMHVPPATFALPGDNPLPEFDKMLAMPLEPAPGAPPAAKPAPLPTGIPLDVALEGARAAIAACLADGNRVGVAVTDENGQLRVGLGADGVSNGRIYTAVRKDMTAVAFRMSSRDVRAKALADPAFRAQVKPGMAVFAGGLPVFAGDKLVGAIAASGSTQLGDEACARAGLEKIQSRLQ